MFAGCGELGRQCRITADLAIMKLMYATHTHISFIVILIIYIYTSLQQSTCDHYPLRLTQPVSQVEQAWKFELPISTRGTSMTSRLRKDSSYRSKMSCALGATVCCGWVSPATRTLDSVPIALCIK